MPPSQQTPELSGVPELPRFADRLPDLLQSLRETASYLQSARPDQSYLPYWEDMYAVAHNLKGVLQILSCPPGVASAIISLADTFYSALGGDSLCRKNKEAAAVIYNIVAALDVPELEVLTAAELQKPIDELKALYTLDVPHEARLTEIPAHLFYVNHVVSKKAREITLLHLNHCVLEDEILLDEIPLWRTQLNETLLSDEFGRGIIVNFLPFLSSEGSQKLKVWAWIAAASHTRASLKQRVKEIMPKVSITKL